MHFIIPMVFIIQVILTLVGNLLMIRNFRIKAIQFYSDYWEIRTLRVVTLNIVMFICGISSIILSFLGRYYFYDELLGLLFASIIFSVCLFFIGWLGVQQKVINPTLEKNVVNSVDETDETNAGYKQRLLDKINNLFIEDKIHLNSKLTIQDIAQSVGTNRTYVSSIINQHFGVNFCTFVNNHRIHELETLIAHSPELTNQALAEICGFGSVDSLKRAVNNKTGLCVTAWKSSLSAQETRNDASLWS